ncbi:MAG: virulence protein E, partial [Bacteroidaceae bacterium]|nr:virulence protein E [Bacteroidaceae bacterium]
MQQLSLFRGVHDTQPRPVTLEEVVTMMRTDQSVRDLTEKHRYARSTGDEQGASRYKKMMTSFGVAALFEGGRQQKHIVELTGLSLVDIDHIPTERMSEVLALVHGDEHTLLAYTTLSGHGLRILFRYAVNKTTDCPDYTDLLTGGSSTPNTNNLSNSRNLRLNNQEYKRVFEQGNEYYSSLLGIEYDHQCKNIGRISTIAYDEELYYNPEATSFIIVPEEKKTVGRPKKGKSEEVRVKRCEAAVLRELERRGVVYEAGTYNKYVSAACYEMNRYGVPEEQCREWAVNRFADYDAAEVASIVRSCYLQTEEHGTARLPKAEKESRYASIKDIQEWLTENNIRIRHNVITRKREMAPLLSPQGGKTPTSHSVSSPLGGNEGGLGWFELTDQHVNSLYCRFCLDTGRQAKISDFYIIIESDFYPEYHPLKEYLESLPVWDGMTDHIDRLASTVHVTGCTQELHNRFFKKWMVAMVAAWLDDGTTNHEILTYIGEQGKYKTSFMTHLLPPALDKYFAIKHFNHSMSKDDRLALTELALIDLEELDNMRPEAVNLLKAITTDPAINLRPVWERYALRRQHIASFCGTGNNPRFLTDLSGNRRWLPFMVESIDSPWERTTDYDGIYAQAYALWQQGFRYWFDDAENAELEQHNRQFEEPNIEEELILTYLRKPYGDEAGEFLTATRIIELIGMY